jgi:hypothetical protein
MNVCQRKPKLEHPQKIWFMAKSVKGKKFWRKHNVAEGVQWTSSGDCVVKRHKLSNAHSRPVLLRNRLQVLDDLEPTERVSLKDTN